jgi:hypothetical protein
MILDTSAVNAFDLAIMFHIKNEQAADPPEQRGPEFLDVFGRILHGFKERCNWQPYTSSEIFSVEIDPGMPGSKLHHQDELLDVYAQNPAFIENWRASCEQLIPTEGADDDEIHDLRGYLDDNPGRRDLSLIVAALRVSQSTRGQVVLVSDDLPLINCVQTLCRTCPTVTLPGSQFETKNLTCNLSLEALSFLHRHCGITNQVWKSVTLSFALHNAGRTGPSAARHLKNVSRFLDVYHRDCLEKNKLDITRQLAQEFGGE